MSKRELFCGGLPSSKLPGMGKTDFIFWIFLLLVQFILTSSAPCPRPCSCPHPTELRCTFRSLSSIPAAVPKHTERINLGFNSIQEISEKSLVGLKKLELLMLHGNNIYSLPDGAFRDLTSLQMLMLSFNKLKKISRSNFQGLWSLARLHLDHNYLEFIPPDAFQGLTSLRLLQLEGNQLQQLHPATFTTFTIMGRFHVSTLRHLHLTENGLTSLPAELLETMPQLENLFLHGNPWSCDCSMRWLHSWEKTSPGVLKCKKDRNLPKDELCPVCSSPRRLLKTDLHAAEDLICSRPLISSPQRTPPEEDQSETMTAEDFKEPIGNVSLGLSDEHGNRVDLDCSVSEPRELSNINWEQRNPLQLVSNISFSVDLECPVDRGRYEQLWRLIAYYSSVPAHLERGLMVSKDPHPAFVYRQSSVKDALYYTGVKVTMMAQPEWLMQTSVDLQLNRLQSSAKTVQLILGMAVSKTLETEFVRRQRKTWVSIKSTNATRKVFTVMSGGPVQMDCDVRSSERPGIQWLLPDGSKMNAPHSSPDNRVSVSANGKLVIRAASHKDTGVYYCVARVKGDFSVLNFYLNIQESSGPLPGEETSNAPIEKFAGLPVSLNCETSGSPDADVHWILPNNDIVSFRRNSSRAFVLPNGTLTIRQTLPVDSGYYKCVALNPFGADSLSTKVTLLRRKGLVQPLRKFPSRPQSASGINTQIKVLADETEASGDVEVAQDEAPIKPSDGVRRMIPVKESGHPSRNVWRRPPLLRTPAGSRIDNRRRTNVSKNQIDQEKWADILAKIRNKNGVTVTPLPTHYQTRKDENSATIKTPDVVTEPHQQGDFVKNVSTQNAQTRKNQHKKLHRESKHKEVFEGLSTTAKTQTTQSQRTTKNPQRKSPVTKTSTSQNVITVSPTFSLFYPKENRGTNAPTQPTSSRGDDGKYQSASPLQVTSLPTESPTTISVPVLTTKTEPGTRLSPRNRSPNSKKKNKKRRKRPNRRKQNVNKTTTSSPKLQTTPRSRKTEPTAVSFSSNPLTTESQPASFTPSLKESTRQETSAETFSSPTSSYEITDGPHLLAEALPESSSTFLTTSAEPGLRNTNSPSVLGDFSTTVTLSTPQWLTDGTSPQPTVVETDKSDDQHSPTGDGKTPSLTSPSASPGFSMQETDSTMSTYTPSQSARTHRIVFESHADLTKTETSEMSTVLITASTYFNETESSSKEAETEPTQSPGYNPDHSAKSVLITADPSTASNLGLTPTSPTFPDIIKETKPEAISIPAASTLHANPSKETTSPSTRQHLPGHGSFPREKPRITTRNFQMITVKPETDAQLPCEAEGLPMPFLSWTKVSTGLSIAQNTKLHRFEVLPNGTLIIRKAQVMDSGQYLCAVQNQFGTDRRIFSLTVQFQPPRILQPRHRDIAVPLGGDVDLDCEVEGFPPASVTWVLPSQVRMTAASSIASYQRRVLVEKDGSLQISQVGYPDRGIYKCIGSSEAGSDSVSVHLQVLVLPPVIQQFQQENMSLPEGGAAYIHCSASDSPPPTIHWITPDGMRLSASQLVTGRNFVIFPNGTLYIRELSPGNSGRYVCSASNNMVSSRRTVVLNVLKNPQIRPTKASIVSSSPLKTEVIYGGKLLLDCLANGEPEPRVIWRTPSKKLVDSQYSFDPRIKVFYNGTVTVNSVTDRDGGDYLCVARNKMGDDYVQLRVNVLTKPAKIEQKQQTSSQEVAYGEDLKVDCLASGLPNPEISWALPDGTMVNSVKQREGISAGRSRRYVVFDNGTLYFNDVGMPEEGDYTCYAENQLGKDEMKVRVRVKEATSLPRILNKDQKTVRVFYSETVTLQCNAKGEPEPRITWMSPTKRVISPALDKYQILDDGTLVVQKVQRSDGGNYTCMARNTAGQDQKVIKLEVLLSPPVINGLPGTTNVIKVTAVENQQRLVDCVAKGTPSPRVAWILPGNVVLPAPYYSNRITVHLNGTLEMRSPKKTDSGQLVCVARNEGGEVRLVVNLDVKGAVRTPQTRSPGADGLLLTVGNTMTLNCTFEGLSLPHPTWILPNGTPLHGGVRFDKYFHRFDGSLIISNPTIAEAGVYRCVGHTAGGLVEHKITLFPGIKTEITNRYMSPVNVMNGETLFLHCQTTEESLRMTWTLPSGVVLNRPQRAGRYAILPNGTLAIQQASVYDRGPYVCRAANEYGSSLLPVSVNVLAHPPQITSGPPSVTYVKRGVAVQLNCAATGIPKVEMAWETPDKTRLVAGAQPRLFGNKYLHPQGSLVIQNPTNRDAGIYRCTARNAVGTDAKATILNVF